MLVPYIVYKVKENTKFKMKTDGNFLHKVCLPNFK